MQAHVRGSSRFVYSPDTCGTPPLRSRNSDIWRLKERASIVSIIRISLVSIFFANTWPFFPAVELESILTNHVDMTRKTRQTPLLMIATREALLFIFSLRYDENYNYCLPGTSWINTPHNRWRYSLLEFLWLDEWEVGDQWRELHA